VEGALVALRKHGYAATSLSRVADEAGTSKRMVLHYFSSRDALFEVVVRRVGGRLLGQVELAIAAQSDPRAALCDGLDRLWEEILADPGLHGVFVGLLAESVVDDALRASISRVRGEYRAVLEGVIRASPAGDVLELEQIASVATLVLAAMVGLTIDFLERGETPALHRAFAGLKAHVHVLTAGAQITAPVPT
jgi:AcrR family transcriptional regulator